MWWAWLAAAQLGIGGLQPPPQPLVPPGGLQGIPPLPLQPAQPGLPPLGQALGQLPPLDSQPGLPPLGQAGLPPLPPASFGQPAPEPYQKGGTAQPVDAGSATLRPDAPPAGTANFGFTYFEIEPFLLQEPGPLDAEGCQQACVANERCRAWEVCAPLGNGCNGCYLVSRAPERKPMPGWQAEVVRENPERDCSEFLLEANGADPETKFHDPENLVEYNRCMWELRGPRPKAMAMAGVHYPTMLLTNFRDPPVRIPPDVEEQMTAARGTQRPMQQVEERSQVINYLHQSMGLRNLDPEVDGPAPHAYVLPYYDTNIGHWMKKFGSMNVLQSYEMQSLLRPGDVVVDAGANLGSYTIGFAEKVGLSGAVLAFEPFRWLHQLLTANVALNGLTNVWTFPLGLGDTLGRIEARPPQLRFFSSPGGVRVLNQTNGLSDDDVYQLYDMDMPPEQVGLVTLDDVVFGNLAPWPVPTVQDVRLIKIDVEGMEQHVIRGASRVVQTFKPIIWTENVAYFDTGDTSFLGLLDYLEYSCAKAQNAPNDLVCFDKHGRGHQL